MRIASAQTKADTAQVDSEIAGLIVRARGYDREAFASLYRLTVTPIYRYFSTRVNRSEDAEELTQEVFLAALDRIQSLRADNETGLLAWLFQIARNKFADHLRQRYRKPVAPLQEAETAEASQERPEDAAETNEEQKELRQALQRLTPEQRDVIVCKYVLGYDNQRTARLVGKNIN